MVLVFASDAWQIDLLFCFVFPPLLSGCRWKRGGNHQWWKGWLEIHLLHRLSFLLAWISICHPLSFRLAHSQWGKLCVGPGTKKREEHLLCVPHCSALDNSHQPVPSITLMLLHLTDAWKTTEPSCSSGAPRSRHPAWAEHCWIPAATDSDPPAHNQLRSWSSRSEMIGVFKTLIPQFLRYLGLLELGDE